MIQIGNKIVSSELFEVSFICHLERCKGLCCVIGDSGAPLEIGEVEILERDYDEIKHYITEEGKESIAKQGKWIIDPDGDKVTPLVEGAECAYACFDHGIAFCGIEKAWEEGKCSFRKPASCHLYPIRVSKIGEYTALNYHKWHICEPARVLGGKNRLPLFRFLKEALIRVYGTSFYEELEIVHKELIKND